MREPIMVACDLHDKTMVLLTAQGRQQPLKQTLPNTPAAQKRLIAELQKQARGRRVVFAYEASGLGFGLHDALTDAGLECHVLAPTKMPRSVQHGKRKTDETDAQQILAILRGHVLAGNPLPQVWAPDPQTRDDREIVRTRLDLADKSILLKNQIQTLLKRNQLRRPVAVGKGWTKGYWAWLRGLTKESTLGPGQRDTLASLLRQLEFFEAELERVEQQLLRLVDSPRYRQAVRSLHQLQGVGVLTALVFLTELGDLQRFTNRRQIGAYLGLVPSTRESGTRRDCKGHITRQGSPRLRRILCQATWTRMRSGGHDEQAYQQLVAKNPKHKKIAVVALMRRLAIRMWHCALQESPQQPTPGDVPRIGRRRTRGHAPAA